MKHLRILLADDHELLRRGLRAVLEDRAGWEVCAEAANGREAVELAIRTRPHVAILDYVMPELNGLEAMVEIRSALPKTEVLILTVDESEELMRESVNRGARGFLLKTDATALLLQAVENLSEHRPFFTGRASQVLLDICLRFDGPSPQSISDRNKLSSREREIIRLIAEGKSSKETAMLLGISTKTAENHRANILCKLKLHNTAQLVRYAVRNRLVMP